MNNSITKTCRACKKAKPLNEFGKEKGGKYGVRSKCLVCRRKQHRKYYQSNREDILKRQRRQYREDREPVLNRVLKWRERNPNKSRAYDAVNNAIRAGKLKPARKCLCVQCGASAHDYHHHKGYSKRHRLDVIPLCRPCHGKERRLQSQSVTTNL